MRWFFALLLLSGVAFAQSQQPPSAQPAQPPTADQRGTDQVPLTVKILPTPGTNEKADKEERERKEKAIIDEKLTFETQRIADYTDRLALFTVFLFCVAVMQAGLFVWQLLYMRKGVRDAEIAANAATEGNKINRENFVAMRRAWLSIEDVKLLPPTKFTDDGFAFRVSATAKHHGETPATSVWIEFESYFPEENEIAFMDAQQQFRGKLRNRPSEMGETLFKGDTFTTAELWGDGPDKIKNAIKTRPNGERKLGFTVFIGVSYRIIGDTTAHVTQYAYGMLNVPVGTEIPEGKSVNLPPRQPFLAGEID
jgi:hypothetical protein